jgi:hypothetical protein
MGISNGPKENVTASVTATGAQHPVSIFFFKAQPLVF